MWINNWQQLLQRNAFLVLRREVEGHVFFFLNQMAVVHYGLLSVNTKESSTQARRFSKQWKERRMPALRLAVFTALWNATHCIYVDTLLNLYLPSRTVLRITFVTPRTYKYTPKNLQDDTGENTEQLAVMGSGLWALIPYRVITGKPAHWLPIHPVFTQDWGTLSSGLN